MKFVSKNEKNNKKFSNAKVMFIAQDKNSYELLDFSAKKEKVSISYRVSSIRHRKFLESKSHYIESIPQITYNDFIIKREPIIRKPILSLNNC